MKRNLHILLILLCFTFYKVNAQTAANASWSLTSNQNAVTSGSVTATNQLLHTLNHFDYISGGERTIPSGNTWPAESSYNATRYMEYAIAPASGYTLNISEIEASLSFNGSGAGRASIFWSTDKSNFTPISGTIILNSSSSPTPYTFDNLNIDIHDGDTLFLRIFPWTTSVITGKYLVAKNIKITGTASTAPQVTWPLTANQSAVSSGNIAAHNQKLNNLTVNNYISGNGGQRILPSSGTWPAESVPNTNRFIEYKISPSNAHDMTIKELSIPLSFNSSSYAHARIAWSSDSVNFTNLATDISVATGSVPVEHKFENLHIEIPFGKAFYLRVYPWTTSSISDKYLVSKNVRIKVQTNIISQIAFPEAEGGGRNASGGRGGQIYYVTNLNNSGTGSLRDAVSEGNRTILFKTSGTIFLESPIVIQKDNITIAGQTAPGDGICLANYGLAISASNVIIRYLRSRPGDIITRPGDSTKTVDAMYNTFGTPIQNPFRNIIVDHCSLSWSTDEAASFYAIAAFTLQWSIISESLYRAAHPKPTPHGYGGIWGGQNASFHHNLLASHSNRNPRFSGSENNGQPELEYVDFRNNVIFNWYGGTYGGIGGHQNMVNNYYKGGPATAGTFRKKRILSYSNATTIQHGKFYIDGNYVNGFPDVTADNWTGIDIASGIPVDSIKATTPFSYTAVNTQSATDAYSSVLNSAGAILPRRDTVDRRIVKEVQTGVTTFADTSFSVSGMDSPSGIIDSQTTVGGWPTLNTTIYPKDSDNDGLPDWWEAKQNGNSTDSTSVNRNAYATDGYTFLEKYINSIPSPDQQVVFENVNGARLNNSDTVQVNFNVDWGKDQYKFELYRSSDNNTFSKIKEINGDINKTNYFFQDIFSTETPVYYKIGSIRNDHTGSIFYSNTIQLPSEESTLSIKALSPETKNQIQKNQFSLYPNPADKQIIIKHNAALAGSVIFVSDMSGKIRSKHIPDLNDTSSTIEIHHLPVGIYVLSFKNSSDQKSILFYKK
ncbi:hypothetical protein Pedsa_1800 [Pseudopedobacter saltans DSM 12145]|uniref:Secretion system C-terminal sorting domain-containing protein n=1 Tax=Pseudopedobacter saltans (strain ATCC 51119 / DSM 12145 / JCM 21818 / CCUG 39354 / LMG 10337 / NBRC 100064 / NCIMB 13643) TaxID=762903 RepID=F0S893_PSESL|nr:T9SS type A sorting domain-containing protein [Pseudopedobacter saltans]ADY52355.1 hypothetical protein Pedsa_1800 [Pseudopedobacter saltans DSM 12145]